MTHTGFIVVKRVGQAVWSPSEPVMNDVMDAVKMPEVTMIGDVAFMMFAMFAVVRRVSRPGCFLSSLQRDWRGLQCVRQSDHHDRRRPCCMQSYPQPEKSSSPLAEATRSADFEIT